MVFKILGKNNLNYFKNFSQQIHYTFKGMQFKLKKIKILNP